MKDENEKTENYFNYEGETPIPLPETEELSNIYYNCTKCPSLIEIISINEKNNIMEFKCINKNNVHDKGNITIPIKDYLGLMSKYKNENFKDLCELHKNNNYVCYCYECERQLCNACLKTKIHKSHKKIIFSELQPDDEELKIVEKKLEEFEKTIKKYEIKKYNKTVELNRLNNDKTNENKILEDIIKKIKIL